MTHSNTDARTIAQLDNLTESLFEIYTDPDMMMSYITAPDTVGAQLKRAVQCLSNAAHPAGRFGLEHADTIVVLPVCRVAVRELAAALKPLRRAIARGVRNGDHGGDAFKNYRANCAAYSLDDRDAGFLGL